MKCVEVRGDDLSSSSPHKNEASFPQVFPYYEELVVFAVLEASEIRLESLEISYP